MESQFVIPWLTFYLNHQPVLPAEAFFDTRSFNAECYEGEPCALRPLPSAFVSTAPSVTKEFIIRALIYRVV